MSPCRGGTAVVLLFVFDPLMAVIALSSRHRYGVISAKPDLIYETEKREYEPPRFIANGRCGRRCFRLRARAQSRPEAGSIAQRNTLRRTAAEGHRSRQDAHCE